MCLQRLPEAAKNQANCCLLNLPTAEKLWKMTLLYQRHKYNFCPKSEIMIGL